MNDSGYALLDSGEGEKLERFGAVTLVRPTSLAIWKRRCSATEWRLADARFEHQNGWEQRNGPIPPWEIDILGARFSIELQKNGQVGLFPEHIPLIAQVVAAIAKRGAECRLLNLFGYTGLATLAALRAGAIVTHVDISKRCLDSARENVARNGLPMNRVRFIPEDALAFVERELRRESAYDIVLADPPSFSRLSRSKTWKFEEIITPFTASVVKLIRPTKGLVAISSHHLELGAHTLRNLLADADIDGGELRGDILPIWEQSQLRALPAACYATLDLASTAST